jgi:hypothetical protein
MVILRGSISRMKDLERRILLCVAKAEAYTCYLPYSISIHLHMASSERNTDFRSGGMHGIEEPG